MNNSFRIIFIKIVIIKVNIIKVYGIKTLSITKKRDIMRICINKDYIIIKEYNIIKFLKDFISKKPIRNKF